MFDKIMKRISFVALIVLFLRIQIHNDIVDILRLLACINLISLSVTIAYIKELKNDK